MEERERQGEIARDKERGIERGQQERESERETERKKIEKEKWKERKKDNDRKRNNNREKERKKNTERKWTKEQDKQQERGREWERLTWHLSHSEEKRRGGGRGGALTKTWEVTNNDTAAPYSESSQEIHLYLFWLSLSAPYFAVNHMGTPVKIRLLVFCKAQSFLGWSKNFSFFSEQVERVDQVAQLVARWRSRQLPQIRISWGPAGEEQMVRHDRNGMEWWVH